MENTTNHTISSGELRAMLSRIEITREQLQRDIARLQRALTELADQVDNGYNTSWHHQAPADVAAGQARLAAYIEAAVIYCDTEADREALNAIAAGEASAFDLKVEGA